MTRTVVCVGSAAVDIKARQRGGLRLGVLDSGTVFTSSGGIARNMAENFARLHWNTYLLAALGDDFFGEYLLNEMKTNGIHTQLVQTLHYYATTKYVAMLDEQGVPQLSVFDGDITQQISPETIRASSLYLQRADLVASDLNPSMESIAYLAQTCLTHGVRLYLNATVPALAPRLLDLLEYKPFIGMNHVEAEILAQSAIHNATQAQSLAAHLFQRGARGVLISLGAQGLVYFDQEGPYTSKAQPAKVVETTGAGDALAASFFTYHLQGFSIKESFDFALAAAALTVESERSVNPDLSVAAVTARMQETQEVDWRVTSRS